MMTEMEKKMLFFAQTNLDQHFAVIFLLLIIICLTKEDIAPKKKVAASQDKPRIMKFLVKKASILKN